MGQIEKHSKIAVGLRKGGSSQPSKKARVQETDPNSQLNIFG